MQATVDAEDDADGKFCAFAFISFCCSKIVTNPEFGSSGLTTFFRRSFVGAGRGPPVCIRKVDLCVEVEDEDAVDCACEVLGIGFVFFGDGAALKCLPSAGDIDGDRGTLVCGVPGRLTTGSGESSMQITSGSSEGA